jgi:hypothetical protein
MSTAISYSSTSLTTTSLPWASQQVCAIEGKEMTNRRSISLFHNPWGIPGQTVKLTCSKANPQIEQNIPNAPFLPAISNSSFTRLNRSFTGRELLELPQFDHDT